ncbi:MAG TPA: NADH-quinone oxidoreductase subunit M, partial [Candidatus Marinimicrobia bacterium]|nr:NADH-quinone oxidoreductase subunit M [Candidatus Neomarinimicrobiota bacterium]
METNILSWIIWIPLLGMAAIAFVPRGKTKAIKIITAVATGVQFLATLGLLSQFDLSTGGFQFMERATWIPSFNITYILGVDGLSLPMVILTGLLFFLSTFVSWNINRAVKGYFSLF